MIKHQPKAARQPDVTAIDPGQERAMGAGVFGQPLRVPPVTTVRYSEPSVSVTCPYCGTITSGEKFPPVCKGCYARLSPKGARRPDREDLRKLRSDDPRRLLWDLCRQCQKPGAVSLPCPRRAELLGDQRPCDCCAKCRTACRGGASA